MDVEYDNDQQTRWDFEVKQCIKEVSAAKKHRNYYEAKRKRWQKHLDNLLLNDPRQIKMEFEYETE